MTSAAQQKKEYLHYFDGFRGVAICVVVMGHSFAYWQQDSLFEQVFVNMLVGAVGMFLFISGFLFAEYYMPRFDYWKFLKARAKTILVPYLFLSISFLALYFALHRTFPFPVQLSEDPSKQTLYALGLDLLVGRSLVAYWYIPFIMLVFALSPVFIWFARLPLSRALMIMLALCLFAMVSHRAPHSLNLIQNLFFFSAWYMAGILYSRYRSPVNAWLEGKVLILFAAALCMALLMTFSGQVGLLYKWNPFEFTRLDLGVPKTAITIPFYLALFLSLQKYRLRLLTYIAHISFAIYFLHPWFLLGFDFLGINEKMVGFAGFWMRAGLTLTGSIAAAWLGKKMLGSRSKYLIGY